MSEALAIALKLAQFAFEKADAAGKSNVPEWAKWVNAGFAVIGAAKDAADEYARTGVDKFDKMTPAEVEQTLTPPEWADL